MLNSGTRDRVGVGRWPPLLFREVVLTPEVALARGQGCTRVRVRWAPYLFLDSSIPSSFFSSYFPSAFFLGPSYLPGIGGLTLEPGQSPQGAGTQRLASGLHPPTPGQGKHLLTFERARFSFLKKSCKGTEMLSD